MSVRIEDRDTECIIVIARLRDLMHKTSSG